MRTFISMASLAGLFFLMLCPSLYADVPPKINYRGWLDGYPPSQVTETLVFRLYDGPSSSSPLNEVTTVVDIFDGNFSVLLDFAPSDFLGTTRYIGVFKEDGITELTNPRPQVVTVPYAYQAGNLYSTSDGKVGIGTTEPAETLDVIGNIRTTGSIVLPNGKIFDGHSLDSADGSPGDVVYVDTEGRVGIGRSNPSQKLDVLGNIGTSGSVVFPNNKTFSGHSLDSADGSPADVVYVDNSGNVGIGTTGPAEKLDVAGTVKTSGGVTYPDGGTQTRTFDGHSLDASDGNPVDALWIDSSGNAYCSNTLRVTKGTAPSVSPGADANTYGAYIKNYSPSAYRSSPYGLRAAIYDLTGRSLDVGYMHISGDFLEYGSNFHVRGDGDAWLRGTLTQNSDARLKEDIEPLSDCLGKVMNLQGVTYNWRPDETGLDREDIQVGFIGQEVHEVIPELAPVDENGRYGVIYDRLVPVLVEAVKEQQGIINSQNSKIDMLEKELETMKTQISRFQSLIEERN